MSSFKEFGEKLGSNLGWISGAIALVGSILNYAQQRKTNKELMEFNRSEADIQRQWTEVQTANQNTWNKQMWQEQNEYNSPESQKERLADAGLNPMYYGIDGIPAASVTAAQPLAYERASLSNLVNPLTTAVDTLLKGAQVSNIDAQTQKTKTETKAIDAKLPFEIEEIRSRVRNSNLSSDAQEIINKYLDAQQEAELRMKNASVAEAEAAVKKAFAEIDKMDYEKVTLYLGWLETQEKILNLQKQRELTDKQMQELSALIGVYNAQAKKLNLDITNYDDITVIGTASHSFKFGPFSVQEGEPITLAMKKAADKHREELQNKEKERKDKNTQEKGDYWHRHEAENDTRSAYDGAIYD